MSKNLSCGAFKFYFECAIWPALLSAFIVMAESICDVFDFSSLFLKKYSGRSFVLDWWYKLFSKFFQVGAISAQSMPIVLQSVRECLENNDWATRKAAADTLSVLASQSSHLIADGATQTMASLEACRFDKVTFMFLIFMDLIR